MWWWSDAAIGVFNSLIKCLASRRKAQEKKAHATIPMLSWITKEKILRKKKGYRYSYHQEVKEWWHLLATQKEGESHNKWSDALQVVVLIPLTNQETPQNHTIILPKNEIFFSHHDFKINEFMFVNWLKNYYRFEVSKNLWLGFVTYKYFYN